ncbi:alpha/beta fold hydrolase [Flammeovirga sp. SJP92]|uniref:alpha/beta fold hydrolase n=1 Tax=Flammeovirga sp. SJP92 TaxID=1775430 RepID=UPI000787A72E|nr:alpha/beta hydrolase [Flammeovirga sp. SJP92]KXX71473.1 alpha/beta hydrolase [Flammeovirga sp. SJP92]
MSLTIREKHGFKYIDEGEGEVLILLHGLFGALSNWSEVLGYFSGRYRVIIPMLPIYNSPRNESNLEGLVAYTEKFVEDFGLTKFSLLGNSLGGHVSLLFTLANPDKVEKLILTGSSGLYESGMGLSYPKRGSYEFIKDRVGYTFYDPEVATKELVDEVFEVTSDSAKCLRIVYYARSAQKHNLRDELNDIKCPTLLIWGLNDTITPPSAGHEFHRRIPNSELHFIDKCCHVPMMEHPNRFNMLVDDFLRNN